jgi:23S rRNA pseudouridine955/2504/2580 synthase
LSSFDKSTLPDGAVRRGVRKLRITADDAGQRIDNFLARELKGLPRSRVYRLLRKGEVRVNGGRIKADYRLTAGDELRLPPVTVTPVTSGHPDQALVQRMLASIVYEDKRLLVVNKPSGVAVHGGSGISFGVVEALRGARPELRTLELAHRLDRETSGCLVLAKKRSALRELHALFRDGAVEKSYLALVAGDWQQGTRVIDLPLAVNRRKSGERHVAVDSESGKASRTRFSVQTSYGDCTLLKAEPETGRTHQIRVHAAACGHPVLGDERYGDQAANARFRQSGLRRLFLHAQSIAFADDSGNERLFIAPLPEELDAVLERLQRRRRR